MICEIINPSDPYTLLTDEFLPAGVAVFILGRGQLGLSCDDPEQDTPVLFGWEEWLRSWCGDDLRGWVHGHFEPMAAALESVLIGTAAERRRYEVCLKRCDDPEALRAEWHDEERSSVNDIGRAAWSLAAHFRELAGSTCEGES